MPERYVYRVRWVREPARTEDKPYTAVRHYETLEAAQRCAARQLSAREDIAEWFTDDMGNTDWSRVPRALIALPVIERRLVLDGWEALDA